MARPRSDPRFTIEHWGYANDGLNRRVAMLGSIEAGKLADFAVLEQDPTLVGGAGLRDIKVWGTVFEGRVFKAVAPSVVTMGR